MKHPAFLPTTRAEMDLFGWEELDVLLVTGDAYVDHASFAVPLIGRWLFDHGLRVGIVAQPRWDSAEDVCRMGRPKLFAGAGAGALDSMLAHYTAFRKKRGEDSNTPGGLCGARPNRAAIVYTGLLRNAFPGLPVVLGGIEASLRRAAHYDFWTDKMRRPLLFDSKADIIVSGMGERAVLEIAENLRGGKGVRGIRGTAFLGSEDDIPEGAAVLKLPSFEEIEADPKKLMRATLDLEAQVDSGAWAVQACGKRTVVFAPPSQALSTEELDRLYELGFTRLAHPSYEKSVPAVETMLTSITSHRGCSAGCTFCALTIHQGRQIASRSKDSILREVASLTRAPFWKGTIGDVGGPSANMWGARCKADPKRCKRPSCLDPEICPAYVDDQEGLAQLLNAVKETPGVKHVRVSSGVRHDLAMRSESYLDCLIGEFTGGQLKVAPEHCADSVLKTMRKPGFRVFEGFLKAFERVSRKAAKEQFLVPYLISAFPGCTDEDMRALARWLGSRNWKPRQVQCFVPTPGTVATAMFFGGIDPEGNKLHVARTDAERLRQHGILVPHAKK